jgi:hypothetical protein
MPTVAIVDGVRIVFYVNEHPPPHFHAVFAEHRVSVDIETLAILNGSLPRAKERIVLEWAREHQDELRIAWNRASNDMPPGRIE